MLKNILIIGVGNIGLRHLESLVTSKKKLVIYLVDPKKKNIEKKISKLKKKNHQIIFFDTINFKKIKFDCAIISTNSDIRKNVINRILNTNFIKHIIIEKVAFNNVNDLNKIMYKIKKNNTKFFINYPRTYMESYINLKKQISPNKKINMKVVGSKWGLASNSFHFVNLFSFLNNFDNLLIKEYKLSKPYKTKRNNFYDFYGNIFIKTKKNHTLSLECSKIDKNISYILIENGKSKFVIYEKYKKILIMNYNEKLEIKSKNFGFRYQSQLTLQLIQKKLFKNINKLETNYDNEKKLLNIFQKEFKRYDQFKNTCPIT